MKTAQEVKTGNVIMVNGQPMVVLKTEFNKSGRNAAVVKMKMKNLLNEQAMETVFKADEKFEAIGRGLLNIEGLPVYRDNIGGIGTPTSDEERTKITLETTNLLMIINGYSGEKGLAEVTKWAKELLNKHAAP